VSRSHTFTWFFTLAHKNRDGDSSLSSLATGGLASGDLLDGLVRGLTTSNLLLLDLIRLLLLKLLGLALLDLLGGGLVGLVSVLARLRLASADLLD
jgi:hypothetical protein